MTTKGSQLSLGDLPSRDSISSGLLSPQTPSSSAFKGTNSLASRVTSILSTSYSDTEFRDALSILDERGVRNDARVRRQIRLDLLKDVIDGNGEVVARFGHVAEVSEMTSISANILAIFTKIYPR